jgi:cytochrome c556
MDQAMAQFMPEGMRKIGLEMHRASSSFAVEAKTAEKSGNPQLALKALSRVTQQCVACHSAYRLQ